MYEDSEPLRRHPSSNPGETPKASSNVEEMTDASSSRASGWRSRIHLLAPVDLMPLACFRIFFGAMMLYHVFTYLSSGYLEPVYLLPKIHFTYFGFDWVKPWSGQGMYVHFGVMGLASFGILAGCMYRISAGVFAVCFTHAFLIEESMYQNHYYLICLISCIMVFVPAHGMWSVDAWWNPRIRSQTAPQIWLWLLRIQLAITYFYGGIAKINYDWLHGMPMQMWLEQRTWLPVIGPWISHDASVMFFAWGGMIFDLTIVPALLWRPTRRVAYFLAFAFHLANSVLWNIGIFPWFMIGATLLFFPADTFRRTLFGRGIRKPAPSPANRRQRFAVAMVGVYVAWQLLFPLRHYLYPGNVSWTAEGRNFSWHMMLIEKQVKIGVFSRDNSTGKLAPMDVSGILYDRQPMVMPQHPHMILQFAHFLRDQHHNPVEIRVLALASLNGRKPQLLIDPTINYAEVEQTWGVQPWIVSLYEPLPKKGRHFQTSEWNDAVEDLIPDDMKSPDRL
jgi:vitamin K-dependent gamma-carboxylase